MVRSASGDEFLSMRLIRDEIPGVGELYIQFPKEELVKALEKYSPLRQIGPDNGEPALTGESSTPPPPSVRRSKKSQQPKLKIFLVETEEGRIPPFEIQNLSGLALFTRVFVIEYVNNYEKICVLE
jgi:hypothetical protein